MRHRERFSRTFLAAAAVLLVFGGSAAAAPDPPPTPKKQNAQGANWPRKFPLGDATLSVDAPRAESLEGKRLKARGSARFERADGTVSDGTVWYEADVEIDRDRRTVTLVSVEVPRVDLPGVPPPRQQRIAGRLAQAFSRIPVKLSLDDVLADVRIAARREEGAPKLNTDPPRILFESEPAILVIFDGEPRFRAVEGSRLERALNTPFLVLHDTSAGAYYLSGGTSWFRAESPTGPWTKADRVPPEEVQIAARDLKDAGVAESELEQAKQSADKRVPKILVATEPAELIVSDGPPQWSPAVEGELEAMSNSQGDVFRTVSDRKCFVVLSGRWYRSDSLGDPWTYVAPDRLPESFRRIPADSPKAEVLAFVPGTAPAREALADASKPRMAAIRRSEARVNVTYDGEPRFESVPGTKVEYALNTPDQVLKIRGRYYVCDQGVWFSAGAPTGPWTLADSLPDEEIQSIPPESPVYNTRFAYVYDSTPEAVYTAYTPAYLGSYPYYGAVVFGTGWAYRPWWGSFYYPRFWTWGFHARYAPWAGWGYGFGWGPAWAGFRYGFGFGWGARWCGPGAFFRPAWRNAAIARGVAARNLYASGANRTRAVANSTSTRTVAARGTPGNARSTGAQKQGTGRTPGKGATARNAPAGHANRPAPQARAQNNPRAMPAAAGTEAGERNTDVSSGPGPSSRSRFASSPDGA